MKKFTFFDSGKKKMPERLNRWLFSLSFLSFLLTAQVGFAQFPDPYCGVSFPTVEPISRVLIADAGIDNASSPVVNGTPAHEDFLDVEGDMEIGEDYEIALEGNTDGPTFANGFTVFIDWNQDGEFDNGTERYNIGAIQGSTGADGQQAVGTITVPDDALEGATRLRVVKTYNMYATNACTPGTSFGQAEDYTINVSLPACPKPLGLEADATADGADLSWGAVDNADGYNWYVFLAGDDPGTDAAVDEGTVAGTSVSVSGLAVDALYEAYVEADCDADGNSKLVGPVAFAVGVIDACTPLTSDCFEERIINVTFAGIDNDTVCSPSGYGDYTAEVATVSQEVTYELSVTINWNYIDAKFVYAYIDWNGNGFLGDAGEAYMMTQNNTTDGITTHTRQIEIPAGGVLDDVLMRVVAGYHTDGAPNPCEVPFLFGDRYGEIEDYTVHVLPPPTCHVPSGLVAEVFAGNGDAELSWGAIDNAEEYLWAIFAAGDDPQADTPVAEGSTADTNVLVTGLEIGGSYDAYVLADCGADDGESLWSAPVTFTAGTYGDDIPTMQNAANFATPDFDDFCEPEATITIDVPDGYRIVGLQVKYDMRAYNGSWINEQRSLIYSPTLDAGETTAVSGVGGAAGTYSYDRTLDFAHHATGSIDFVLRAWRTYSSPLTLGCDTDFNYVVGGTWVIIPEFEEAPACLEPTNFAVTDISVNMATLSWDAVEGSESYTWSIFEAGDDPEVDNPAFAGVTNETSVTLYELTGGTDYEAYIQADCGEVGLSPVNAPVAFSTDPVVGDAPQIICPIDITLPNETGTCGAQVFFNDAQAFDAEDGLLPVVQIAGPGTGSVFPIGTTVISFAATDSDGNTSVCHFNITIEDVDDPIAVCQNYTIELDENGEAVLEAYMLNGGYDYSCTYSVGLYDTFGDGWNGGELDVVVGGTTVLSGLTIATGAGPEWHDFAVSPGESIEILYTAGSWSTENWFQVSDGSQGSGDVIYSTTQNQTPAATHDVSNLCDGGDGSSDGCGQVFFSFDPEGLVTTMTMDCLALGDNEVTLYVTDEGGNQVFCMVIVTVEDNIAPEIVCLPGGATSVSEDFDAGLPAGWSVTANTGTCNWQAGNLPGWTGYVFSTPAIFFDDDACGSGAAPSNVSLTSAVYDLSASASASVTYDVAYRHLGGSSLTIEVFDGAAWQTIDSYTANQTVTTAGPFDVSAYANADFQVRFTFDDGGGWVWGAAIDNFLLEYEVPSADTPKYYLDANGQVAVPITDLYLSATDNCSVSVTVVGAGMESCAQAVADNNMQNAGFLGGDTNQSLAVDIDVEEELTFAIDQIKVNVAGDATFFNIIIREDDGGLPGDALMTLDDVSIVGEVHNGDNFGFPFYTYTLNVSASGIELDGGATGTKYWMEVQSDAVAWESTTASVLGLNGAFMNDGTSGAWIIGTSEYVYELIGLCGSGDGTEAIFTCADLGFTQVTVVATDAAGNTTSCVTTIEIIDDIAPILVTQDITVYLDENGQATITYEDVLAYHPDDYYVITIGGDNGSWAEGFTDFIVDVTEDATISFDWDYVSNDPLAGWDSFGYIINGTYTQLTNPAITHQSGSATVSVSAGDVFGFRAQTDDNDFGNTVTTITEFQPGFTGQFAPENWTEVLTNSDGSAYFVVIPGGALAWDNCGIVTGAVSVPNFTCADIGTPVTIDVFVADASGNTATSTAVVTVVDELAPQIECLEDTVVQVPEDETYTLPDYVASGEVTIVDNCTEPVTDYSQSPAAGTELAIGTHIITITATDEYGNESSCSFELEVEEELGTQDNTLSGVVMYPNPAANIVTIVNNSTISLSSVALYDVAGKVVMTVDLSQMTNEQTLDISGLSSGVYMVHINGEDSSVVKRLIKK